MSPCLFTPRRDYVPRDSSRASAGHSAYPIEMRNECSVPLYVNACGATTRDSISEVVSFAVSQGATKKRTRTVQHNYTVVLRKKYVKIVLRDIKRASFILSRVATVPIFAFIGYDLSGYCSVFPIGVSGGGSRKNPSYYDFVTSLRVSLLLFFVRLWALRDNKEVFKGE